MQPIGVDAGRVATSELRRNGVRMGVEHPHADVKGGIVVQHAHFSRIGRLGPYLRVALGEISGRSRRCG